MSRATALPPLIVAPLHAVEPLLAARQPSHLICLASPDAPASTFKDSPPHRLDLRFNDIAAPREGLTPPSPADIAALLSFANDWPSNDWPGAAPLLIHCWAGVSRSTAAAYIIACAKTAPGQETALAQALRAAAPFATPNPLMIALADAHLRRANAMTNAIAAIGRGAETDWGHSFDLEIP